MPRVRLPDGQAVNFPDGTPPEVMESAMRQYWWEHNDKKLAAEKSTPAPLPKQGEFGSPVEPETQRFYIPTPMGQIAIPTKSDIQTFTEGAGKRWDQVMDRATQLYLRAKGDTKAEQGLEANIKEKRRLNEPLDDSTMGTVGSAATDIALTAIPAGKVAKAATAFPKATRALAGIAGAGSLSGIYDAATRPTVDQETTAGNAEEGFAAGAGGQIVGNVAGRVIKGLVPVSKRAAELPKEVFDQATLGQVADRNTALGHAVASAEEKSKVIPFAGDTIAHQRRQGLNAWRQSVMNKVSPEGMKFDPSLTMRENIANIQDEFATRYKAALKGQEVGPSSAFTARVLKRTNDPMAGLTPQQQEDVRTLTMNYYNKMFERQVPLTEADALADNQFWHGGTFTGQGSPRGMKPLFTSKNKELARSYIEMANEMNGGSEAALHRIQAENLGNKATLNDVLPLAKRIGMDIDAQSPASLFDENIQDPDHVYALIKQLKEKGFGHAELPDLVYGGFPSKDASETAHVIFPGAQFSRPGGKPSITAEQAKDFEAFLTKQARQYRMGNAPQSQNMADLFDAIERDWTSGYRSQLPLSTRQQLKPLDQKYAPFKTAERAGTYVGNEEGNFTPSQLLAAVKARTTKPQFAAGKGMLQSEADAGKTVFMDKLPNPTTAERIGHGVAMGGMVLEPVTTTGLLAAGKAATLPFTSQSGKNFMTGRTRAQILLQQLRADELARQAGVPLGQSIEDFVE